MIDQSQQAAIQAAVTSPHDTIITGGAGTGKTTIIREIMDRLDGRAELLAPTGKAAALLRQRTGYDAQTVHRWLMWDGEEVNRTAPCNVPVIIDEASMLDAWLLRQIIETAPPRIVLVGDAAQLPPVGKGAPFHDLIALRPAIVSTLTTCHRARSAVSMAATAMRAGKMPAAELRGDGESYKHFDTGDKAVSHARILSWVAANHYDATQDVVLACRNGTPDEPGTVQGLNAAIAEIVNPRGGADWVIRDRVMNLKNAAKLDWFNGDTGTITAIDTCGDLWVQPDRGGEEICLDKTARRSLSLAYAATVHKSQGSQYRRVFVLVTKADIHMLSRNLIYTAVTRAQRGVVVVGELGAVRYGLGRTAHKATVLQWIAEYGQAAE